MLGWSSLILSLILLTYYTCFHSLVLSWISPFHSSLCSCPNTPTPTHILFPSIFLHEPLPPFFLFLSHSLTQLPLLPFPHPALIYTYFHSLILSLISPFLSGPHSCPPTPTHTLLFPFTFPHEPLLPFSPFLVTRTSVTFPLTLEPLLLCCLLPSSSSSLPVI